MCSAPDTGWDAALPRRVCEAVQCKPLEASTRGRCRYAGWYHAGPFEAIAEQCEVMNLGQSGRLSRTTGMPDTRKDAAMRSLERTLRCAEGIVVRVQIFNYFSRMYFFPELTDLDARHSLEVPQVRPRFRHSNEPQ